MLKQRDTSHAETPMIRAMLDATGRIAAVGRQASDMALWVSPTSATGQVALTALAEQTAALVPSGGVSVRIDGGLGRAAVRTSDAGALAAALAALAELTARDTGAPVDLSARSIDGVEAVLILLTPTDGAEASPGAGLAGPARESDEPPRTVTLAFDRGGFGLSLALASYVLDAHGADVRTGTAGTSIQVQLQKAGGAQ
jgi:hypothetical protein